MEITTRAPLRTGRRMPIMGLGTWELTDDTAGTVEEALRLGYRMVDTAVDYGSQAGVGEALNRSDLPRDQIFLVAKVEEDEDAYDATRRYLAEMDQERADLMLIHRPPEDGVGEALWRGLMRARDDGLTTDIGVSNYSVEQLEALIDATGEVPVVNQVEWTPFGWKPAMLDYCREREIVVQAWSPLTRGERLDDERLEYVLAHEFTHVVQQGQELEVKILRVDIDERNLVGADEYGADVLVNATDDDPVGVVKERTDGWGADVVLECSGSEVAMEQALEAIKGQHRFATGNVVFEAGKPPASPRDDAIAALVAERRGFRPRVLILPEATLRTAVDRNPFPTGDGKALHLFFPESTPAVVDHARLEAAARPSERFALHGGVLFLHAPEGFARSKLAASVERHLGVAATARNWNTVKKIEALLVRA